MIGFQRNFVFCSIMSGAPPLLAVCLPVCVVQTGGTTVVAVAPCRAQLWISGLWLSRAQVISRTAELKTVIAVAPCRAQLWISCRSHRAKPCPRKSCFHFTLAHTQPRNEQQYYHVMEQSLASKNLVHLLTKQRLQDHPDHFTLAHTQARRIIK